MSILSGILIPLAAACPGPDLLPELRAWLECTECRAGELDAVIGLGGAAVRPLTGVLQDGPPRGRLEQQERYLDSVHAALVNYTRAHPGVGTAPSRAQYVGTYLEKYKAMYRIRAGLGLAAIGGLDARQALESALSDSSVVALTEALHFALDSICGIRHDPANCR